MGKLNGKVAVITGGSSGMALATAQLFVAEGAYVFITGRKKAALDEAVKLIGRNVTGVQADSANLNDLTACLIRLGAKKAKSMCCMPARVMAKVACSETLRKSISTKPSL